MKLAYYHTHHRGDLVWFCKGFLPASVPEAVQDKIRASSYYQNRYGDKIEEYIGQVNEAIAGQKWDRVYVTTLFTYEWDKTVKLIEYAKTLVQDSSQVFVGGVAATLMPKDFEAATGITPMRGLIADSGQLGDEPGVCIDTLVPDYSILEQTAYEYAVSNGYFLTATRGCGNRCSFCAVQTLEPDYQDYISIIPRIEKIRELYGSKRHLYLLDNNIMKSSCFEQIIDDIKTAGYARGATWLNPKTGKPNKCHVDFNQGLDAKFLTEKKAELLGGIALDPAHIAFDHIDERDRYLRAVHLMDKYDIRNISSYLLYNTRNFAGKGSRRNADTPRDLYERMRTNYNVNLEINRRRQKDGAPIFDAFAFPMRFVPLNYKQREFIGDNWNKRLLAGVRTMLQPSHGGVFVTQGYFDFMYGSTYEEFKEILLLPHEYVRHKGKPIDKYDGEPPHKKWLLCIEEWLTRYRLLADDEKETFEGIIAENCFSADIFKRIESRQHKQLFLHYLTGIHLPGFLEAIRETDDFAWVQDYILYQCPSILWCSLELFSQQKTGGRKTETLLSLLFPRRSCETGKDVASF